MAPVPEIAISANHGVFDLPEIVAIRDGLFEQAGLHVRFADADDAAFDPAERDPIARRKEALFEAEQADVFNLCEWGGIDRLERNRGHGRIAYLRPAVVAQGLVSFSADLNEPHDLGGVEVGVNEFTGSHYTALHLLEGTLPRQEIRLRHIGAPRLRLAAVRTGEVPAAMLMEPFLTLALEQGAHLLGSYFYRGSQVIAPGLDERHRAAYISAVDRAVDVIRAAPWRESAELIAAETGAELPPDRLGPAHIRYTRVERFTEKRFAESYAWMKSWGLTKGTSGYGSLLAAR
ncbi:hypothetical protein ACFO4E_17325 [Nocardiopsis mangrovi]|uniref:Nitrate ABC transporter substrate-binding protein n=1 Tax=Nocardiopsis mangrovi TaxID=1179818 RepID=A0ABV9DXS3_9ACTN